MARTLFSANILSDPKSKELRERIQSFNDTSASFNMAWQAEASTDSLIEAGDQTALNSLGFNRVLPYMDMYTSNKIKRMVSMFSGIQRKQRKSTIVIPKENGDQQTADQFSKLIFHINNTCGTLDVISDAFHSASITGLTLAQTWVDYRDDPISGSIKVDLCPYNSFLIDPNFKKHDLSDCNTIWKRSYLTEQECKSLLPEHAKEISNLADSSAGSDDMFGYLNSSYVTGANLMAYDEFYYKDSREQKMLIDTASGERLEYKSQDDELLPIFLQQNPNVILVEEEIPTVKMGILVNGNAFYDGMNPLGIDSFPFTPFFGYLNANVNEMSLKFQGIVRGMRESQFLFNLMTSLEVEYVQSRVNPGVIYQPLGLVDPGCIARRDLSAGIALKKNFTPESAVKFVNPMEIPQSVTMIREQAAKELIENDGGNEELLGSSTDDSIAGILAVMRSDAGTTLIQPLLDSLDLSQRIMGGLHIAILQSNYTPGKVARIIEEEPSQQFYNKTFGKYDAVIEEGMNTSTQRQNQFATVMALKQHAGINFSEGFVLSQSTMQNKQEAIDDVKNMAEQQAQAQQQEQQANQMLQQAEAELANAKSNADNAKALELTSKVNDNRTQAVANLAEANKDDERVALDKIKALKELEGIDLDHLERLVQLSNQMKMDEQASKDALEQKANLEQAPTPSTNNQGV